MPIAAPRSLRGSASASGTKNAAADKSTSLKNASSFTVDPIGYGDDDFGYGESGRKRDTKKKARPATTGSSIVTVTLPSWLEEEDEDFSLGRDEPDFEEMDLTPMVDVTFLLLIFFMVTAAFSLQKSIEMPRQQTDAPSTTVVEQEEEDLDIVLVSLKC